MNGGTLAKFIDSNGPNRSYTENFCKYTIYQIALGVSHMHFKKVIHRDLKGENVCFDPSGKIKLCDFGFSRTVGPGQNAKSIVGTLTIMAPEILEGQI